jgi:hypothetical protein
MGVKSPMASGSHSPRKWASPRGQSRSSRGLAHLTRSGRSQGFKTQEEQGLGVVGAKPLGASPLSEGRN